MQRKLIFIILTLLFLVSLLSGCQAIDKNPYKTYVQDKGVIRFSLEYPSNYVIDSIKPAQENGTISDREVYLSFKGPVDRNENDYAHILLSAGPPDERFFANAKDSIIRAKRNASSWADYKLLNESEISIDGVKAYRIDYQIRSVVYAIAGISKEPALAVYRDVRFDAKGFVWMIQVSSGSSTAEADKLDFEHVLQTFKIIE